jgi:hypothetical protein
MTSLKQNHLLLATNVLRTSSFSFTSKGVNDASQTQKAFHHASYIIHEKVRKKSSAQTTNCRDWQPNKSNQKKENSKIIFGKFKNLIYYSPFNNKTVSDLAKQFLL